MVFNLNHLMLFLFESLNILKLKSFNVLQLKSYNKKKSFLTLSSNTGVSIVSAP